MFHEIHPEKQGPLGQPMAEAVRSCIHCGFCLAVCPTYQELGEEMDSPRGRITLMKEVLEGKLPAVLVQPYVDRCLGCLACEPACPTGVRYRDLISSYRAMVEPQRQCSPGVRLRRWLAAATLPFPARFRVAAWFGRIGRRVRPLVPDALHAMLDLLPEDIPPARRLEALHPAVGPLRGRVALLAGCAQQVLDPEINAATIEMLTANGIEVLVPADQGCCGGLAWHTGDLAAARDSARRNLGAFPAGVDAIITNAAGCGSTMHEYPLIFRGTPDETRATEFHRRVVDVSVYLARAGLREPLQNSGGIRRIAYHDACHLANAQGVRAEPRALLRSIPGAELIELPDAHLCCGSAGTYNLDQPAIAAALGRKKAEAVIASGAEVVVSGNIGCLTQLRHHLRRLGSTISVRHTMQVLRDARP
ncbi:MAG: 4Fe-4S dicluster domain-containing protein [Opitutae bacterium]|nr:4Fe-4S dicluster domain-containing protein [Opitutae bacterium]